jgi:plastocyanin
MRKLLLSTLFLSFAIAAIAEDFTVTTSGFTFTPDDLSINEGDQVIFDLGNSHNVIEVSLATWEANQSTSNGGFSTPFGGGTVLFDVPGTYYYVCQPHAGMGMKGMITVSPISNIIGVKASKDIAMYPNPSKGELNFDLNPSLVQMVEILGLNGQVFAQFKIDSEITKVNLDNMSRGIYFVRFVGTEETHTRRLVIE